MKRKLLLFIVLCHGFMAMAQECPALLNPLDGATNVPVTTAISWEAVTGVPGYIISIGTTPGASDIVNQNVGGATSYTPPLGLPENTLLYVTITLFFFNQSDIICPAGSFTTEDVTTAPGCTTLSIPADGATDVNIETNISWAYAPTATGYTLSLGTTPGGGEILNNQALGNVLFYNPPADLPTNTQIYVSVIPTNENGSASPCAEQSFTTGDVVVLPGCTTLLSPVNGAINVPLTPLIEWTPVPGADGYRVTIGFSPFTSEVLDNVVFTSSSTFVIDFEANRTFFITIVPFNSAGEAIGCGQENFSTILGCGPFFDSVTGELITINPEIDFPDLFSLCTNELPFTVSSTDTAEEYRWFEVDQFGNETLLGTGTSLDITQVGDYRYEAFNTASQNGAIIECPSSQLFSVVSSSIATITNIGVQPLNGVLRFTVSVDGEGDYEYAIDNINGPYQDSNVFNDVLPGRHTVFVRDKNGCGVVEQVIEQDLTLEGFPKFFTPNGDGVNDFWQFIPPPTFTEINVANISIFDRYGKFLLQIDPLSQGWDGTFNGSPLPSADYWFKATDDSNNAVTGHFALKR